MSASTFHQVARAHVRLALVEEMPLVLRLIQQLAEFEHLTDICVATVSDLEATLFQQKPFQGPTVLLLELSSSSSHSPASPDSHESVQDIPLRSSIHDFDAVSFTSAHGRTVAGFVLFFPNYSTFLAKHGFYIEDLYVRECFRGHGFGSLLLRSVARLAVERNYGRVEWCVLDWNEKAIKFYEGIGARVLPEWKICRLTGEALCTAAHAPPSLPPS